MAMFYCQNISFLLLLLVSVAVCTTEQPNLVCGVMGITPVKRCNSTFRTPVCHAVYVYRYDDGNFSRSLVECQSEEHCASSSNCVLELISFLKESVEYSCCCNVSFCNLLKNIEREYGIVFPNEMPTIPTIASDTTSTVTNTTMMVESWLQSTIITIIAVTCPGIIIIIALFISATVACCCCLHNDRHPVTGTERNAENVMSLATTLLEERLGEGRDGIVYKGTYEREEVAVKVFRDDQQFQREVAVYTSFGAVNHKNILKFIACDETQLRLVVALHNRGSVYTVIQRQVLSLEAFQLLAETMSSGLAFLHTSGIIHGDFKTGNVLIKDNGEAAICDFGHSRRFFKDHDYSDQRVQCTGTTVYSAPELTSVSLNTRTEYKAADSYSLGMVLYELLTRTQQGQEEVEAHTPLVLHNRPKIPEKFNVFSELVMLVCDLLSESPEARPKSKAAHIALENFRPSIASFRSSAPSSLASGSVSSIAETAF